MICEVGITNKHSRDYYLLKRNTPLDDVKVAASSLSVWRNGKQVGYDGWLVKRQADPSPDEHVLIKGGATVSTQVEISAAYPMNVTGYHLIQLDTEVQYSAVTSLRSKKTFSAKLYSELPFQLAGSGAAKLTVGQLHRQAPRPVSVERTSGTPLDPEFVGGTEAEQSLSREIHRAAFYYTRGGLADIKGDLSHYERWFGKSGEDNLDKVHTTLLNMKMALESDVYTYDLSREGCSGSGVYGYTCSGCRTVYLCDLYSSSPELNGRDTKLCTHIHELMHTVSHASRADVYGRENALDLAASDPLHAIANADNYCYFAETTNVFDNGFDAMAVWSNNKLYVTKGNMYLRYTDTVGCTIDSGYPKLIKGNWGDLTDEFNQGFDAMFNNGIANYVTKGANFVRYTGDQLDGAPLPLGILYIPQDFAAGFDSVEKLTDGKVYVTNGNQYIRASSTSYVMDPGYPLTLQGNWGTLPSSFAKGFDSMARINGKLYATRGGNYICYSGSTATVDAGFPKPIKGNWGSITSMD